LELAFPLPLIRIKLSTRLRKRLFQLFKVLFPLRLLLLRQSNIFLNLPLQLTQIFTPLLQLLLQLILPVHLIAFDLRHRPPKLFNCGGELLLSAGLRGFELFDFVAYGLFEGFEEGVALLLGGGEFVVSQGQGLV